MELFFNEKSIHGQFPDVDTFAEVIDELMTIRHLAIKYGRELYCHRTCAHTMATANMSLQQAINYLDRNKAKALMTWLGQKGPFWDDKRLHSEDDYFECNGDVVTDTAIGECAYLSFSNKSAHLVSLTRSVWERSPLTVDWHRLDNDILSTAILNHLSGLTLEAELKGAVPPILSWSQMSDFCVTHFDNINFHAETFSPLEGRPFVAAAAKSIIDLLSVLSEFKAAHLASSGRTSKGDSLYQQYFTGERAWFSDSSAREKVDFKDKMTFPHPEKPSEKIFSPFHGKVQTPQMRIHFTWPITAELPVHILYVGDKITKV